MKVLKKIGGFLKKHLKLIIVLVIVVGVVLFIRHRAQVAAEELLEAANEPVISKVEKMDLKQSVGVTGTLTANETVTVTSTLGATGVTGVKISKVNFKAGDYVEAGTVVVEFDGDDYERKLAELNAQNNITNLESAQNIEDLQKKIDDINEQIAKDQKWLADNRIYYLNLKDAFEKYEKYKDSDQAVVDRWMSESAACAALADPVSIQLYETKEDGIKTQQRQIEIYQNQIQLAQLRQDYSTTYTQVDAKNDIYESMDKTQVAAPISGYILTMNVEEGNNYAQGNTVFTIADTSGYIVEGTVNEYDIANIKADLPATVKFEATGDEEFEGTVSFVSIASEASTASSAASEAFGGASAAASTSTGTATYKVKIKLNEADDRFRVGMTAKASIILASAKDVLAVPYDCVQEKDDGSFFVTSIADDGTKKDIPVTKGLESDYYVEIKGDGIKEGMSLETIITDAPSTDIMDYMTFE